MLKPLGYALGVVRTVVVLALGLIYVVLVAVCALFVSDTPVVVLLPTLTDVFIVSNTSPLPRSYTWRNYSHSKTGTCSRRIVVDPG